MKEKGKRIKAHRSVHTTSRLATVTLYRREGLMPILSTSGQYRLV
ncbi:hypothetical protein BIW11_03246 [Tropilaelaps mercedesae]|uniref:Uncharacterized protein n=1 Tax=Tropilaelaps mercedesae TaxID=418985 RepID=A0A1V9XPV3_9ACAR|nr:hypothetical protein BIW11_03246 [Tropilaelaps mercedesae]